MRQGEKACFQCGTWMRFYHFQLVEVRPAARMCSGCEILLPILEESRARWWRKRIRDEVEVEAAAVDLSSSAAILARLLAGAPDPPPQP